MSFEVLDSDNILLFCYKNYDVPFPTEGSFKKDLSQIKYIKSLLNRIDKDVEINYRLLLNHIIIMGNNFTISGAVQILLYYIKMEHHSILKSIFLYLNWIIDNDMEYVDSDSNFDKILEDLR